MKIQITKPEQKPPEGFKKGQLVESKNGGIYICTDDEGCDCLDVCVINPEGMYEEVGQLMEGCTPALFKVFNGQITLSND